MRWAQSFCFFVSAFIILQLIYMMVSYRTLCDLGDVKKLVINPFSGKLVKQIEMEQLIIVEFSDYLLDEGECKFEKGKMNCPDVRHLGDTVLRQTQLALVRMLYIFDKICRRHDIKYWMARGSLLGAVRHEGMIPWDNDLDIGMLKEDYEKFRLHSHELPFDMFLQNRSSDKAYQNPRKAFAKLRDNNGCYGYCVRTGCKHHDGLMVDMFVFTVNDQNLLEEYSSKRGFYLDDVFPLKELPFEGFPVFVPNKYKYVLEKTYGDYMTQPSIGRRCPSDGLLGIPWASCDSIEQLNPTAKRSLLRISMLKWYGLFFWQWF